MAACKERNELIDLTSGGKKGDTTEVLYIADSSMSSSTPAKQEKRVLIEDLTGVGCVNCPNAQKEAVNIAGQHPGRVSIIGIHVTDFAIPYKYSKYDFRTQEGTNLMSTYGGAPGSLPMGDVDRVVFGSNENVYLNYPEWGTHVGEELNVTTPVNLTIDTASFDSATRRLTVLATVTYTEAVNAPLYATLMLNESGIVDWQYGKSGWDSTYTHNHVLRKVAQPQGGLKLNSGAKAGQTYHLKLYTILPTAWNPKKMEVIAFVHRKALGTTPATTDLRILQVQEKEIE